MILVTTTSAFTFDHYSVSDSILYAQFEVVQNPASLTYTFRFRDGGAVIERAVEQSPGLIFTSDRTPGHIYSRQRLISGGCLWYESDDFAETWHLMNVNPGGQCADDFIGGRAGLQSQESWIALCDYQVYYTTTGWTTFDSVQVCYPDSIGFTDFTSVPGIIYGWTMDHTNRICVSSDTGRSWYIGPANLIQRNLRVIPGVPDELWCVYPANDYKTYLLRDTAQTVDTVLTPHLPWRPSPWSFGIFPTDHAGELYALASWVDLNYDTE